MKSRYLTVFFVVSLIIIFGMVSGCSPDDATVDEDENGEDLTDEGEVIDDEVVEETSIEIYTFFSGTSVYSVGIAMQEFINEQSDFLRATAIEGRDATANVRILLDDEEARKNTIIWGNPSELWSLRVGTGPYDEANNDIRPFVSNALVGEILVTMDPDIKRLSDLAGKKVAVPPGDSSEVVYLEKLFEAAGVDNVTYERLVFDDLMVALADGRVDASVAYIYVFSLEPIEFQHGTESQEVLTTNVVYPVYKSDEEIATAAELMGNDFPVMSFEVEPHGVLDTQEDPYNVIAYASCFAAHVDMDPKIIHEFLKIYYDNVDKFVDYHPSAKFINERTAGLLTTKPEYIHPAGLEFISEHGYQYYQGMSDVME